MIQLAIPDQPLVIWSKDNPKSRVVMNWVGYDPDGYPNKALLTVIGDEERQRSAVAVINDAYPGALLMRQNNVASTLMVSGGRLAQSKKMYESMIEHVKGQIIMYPAVVEKGNITMRYVIAADVDPGEEIRKLVDGFKKMGGQARLIRFGEYKPEEQPLGDYEEELTPKQSEIVKLALALGLYDTPRRCTLDTVSEVFGISKAAAHNRMKAAERKILKHYFSH